MEGGADEQIQLETWANATKQIRVSSYDSNFHEENVGTPDAPAATAALSVTADGEKIIFKTGISKNTYFDNKTSTHLKLNAVGAEIQPNCIRDCEFFGGVDSPVLDAESTDTGGRITDLKFDDCQVNGPVTLAKNGGETARRVQLRDCRITENVTIGPVRSFHFADNYHADITLDLGGPVINPTVTGNKPAVGGSNLSINWGSISGDVLSDNNTSYLTQDRGKVTGVDVGSTGIKTGSFAYNLAKDPAVEDVEATFAGATDFDFDATIIIASIDTANNEVNYRVNVDSASANGSATANFAWDIDISGVIDQR